MQVIIAAVIAWLIAQSLKLIINLIKTKTIDISLLVASGGMPSSHTATVIAATTMVGRLDGITSTTFAVALIFSLIVMYDATNVRRAVGIQAKEINNLIEAFKQNGHFDREKIKEILGHTPLQVGAGVIIGVLVGMLV